MTDDDITPGTVAHGAAEAIRNLNHLTLAVRGGGYMWPADVDSVIASLEILAQRLPQTLTQAEQWLVAAERAGRVRDDRRREEPEILILGVAAHLEWARQAAEALRQALHDAHQVSARLAGVPDDDPPDLTN
jgi:hypothetical protein